jgi:hypothetical protein
MTRRAPGFGSSRGESDVAIFPVLYLLRLRLNLRCRPGPYINAETTGGGFPGWVGNIAGSLRTNNPNYTQGVFPPFLYSISVADCLR